MRLATGSTRKCCLVTQLDSPDGHRRRLDCARVFHDNAHGFLLGELLGTWDLIWSTLAAADKGVSLPVRVRVRTPGVLGKGFRPAEAAKRDASCLAWAPVSSWR